MAPNQLRWHLLKDVSEKVVKKIKCQEIPPPPPKPTCYTRKYRWNITPIANLFMSGKGPAQAVKLNLPSEVTLIEKPESQYDVEIKFHGYQQYIIEPGYFKKLLLRWARFLKLCDHACNRVIPEYITILRDHNSVEKLHFNGYDENSFKTAIAVINACPDLSLLISDQKLISLVLPRARVNLKKIRTIEIETFDFDDESVNEWKLIWGALAKHVKRFPNLDSLTISTHKVFNFQKCMSHEVVYIIKSIKIDVSSTELYTVKFSHLESIPNYFPNVEKVCLVVRARYNDVDSMKPVQAFNDFECNFHFKFILNLDSSGSFSSKTEAQLFRKNLKNVMSAYGTNDSIVKENRYVKYAATKSYPNKTLVFNLKAWVGFERRLYQTQQYLSLIRDSMR